MRGRCPVTGPPFDQCDCGCDRDDDPRETWRSVPFTSPAPDAARP